MVAPSPAVKRVAKDALNRQLLKSVVVCCVAIFSFFIIMLTSSLISVFAGEIGYSVSMCFMVFLLLEPLLLGVLSFFKRLVFEQDDSVLIIFRYFSNAEEYKRAIQLISILTVKFALSAILLFFPCIVVYLLSTEMVYASKNRFFAARIFSVFSAMMVSSSLARASLPFRAAFSFLIDGMSALMIAAKISF